MIPMSASHQPIRILEVTSRYPPFIGGVENHVYQVSRRLVQKGMDITVLTTDPEHRLPHEEVREGVKIQRVRAWPREKDFYFAPEIYGKIRAGGWDIVHVQCYHTLVPPVAMWAAWRSGIPYVVTFHGGGHSSAVRGTLRGVQRQMLRPFLNHAERLVAVAQFEIPLYGRELHIPSDRFCLIPNGADLPHPLKSNTVQNQGTLIVSMGRLERYKGHQHVIRAMPKLIELIPDIHLWIAGNGLYEPKLRKLVHKLGLESRVDIHAVPSPERERMAKELSAATLVVLLSEFETHPISILEAISLGKPALVTDTSGLRELADKGWARSIALGSSPQQIAAAVVEQIKHPQTPGAFRLPTWDECASSLLDLYQDVVR